jgi:hypothetical protein
VGCVKSALASRSLRECYDASTRGTRCWRCASRHRCVALLARAAPLAIDFVAALAAHDEPRARALRLAVRLFLRGLEGGEEQEEEEERKAASSSSSNKVAVRRERIKALLSKLVNLLVV